MAEERNAPLRQPTVKDGKSHPAGDQPIKDSPQSIVPEGQPTPLGDPPAGFTD